MKNYKVNIDRQKPSSEEILSRRNFDALMKQYNAAPGKVVKKPFWKSAWFAGSLATAVAAVVVTVALLQNRTDIAPAQTNAPVTQGPNTRHADSVNPNAIAQGKRLVAPPLKGLDVAFTNYKVNAAKGGTVTHSSGSKLVFPANAFIDAAGNVVVGNVDIRYREFRDPLDVFLAGIPMQYDSAGKTFQFESAGMLQVAAFVNGKVVYLDKTKPVEVQFASTRSGPEFVVYEFDTALGNWVYQGKDVVQPKDPLAHDKASKFTPQEIATKKAAAETQLAQELSAAAKNNPVPDQPVVPAKANKAKKNFRINFEAKEFPEMATYKGVVFEVDESRGVLDTAKVYHTDWEDMYLSKGLIEGRYTLTFKKGLTSIVADVYPVLKGKNYDDAKKSYDAKFETYQAAFNKRIDAENAARSRYESTLSSIGLSAAAVQIDAKYGQANAETASQVMRVFSINNFGIYNCDQAGSFPQGTQCALQLEDENGAGIASMTSLYHVDRNRFGLFGYYLNGAAGVIASFSFDPNSSNLLWGVREGKLYMADDEAFVPLKGAKSGTLKMKEVKQQFKSAEEMRVFFRITTGA